MNTIGPPQDSFVRDAIQHHLKQMVERELDRDLKDVSEWIEKRKGEIVAGCLVDLMKQVDFETMKDRVVITIRKP